MGRHRSRSRSYSPVRRKRYDEPRSRRRDRRSSPSGPTGLLVRNISLSARPEDLRAPFERFGPVKDVYLPKNYYTGEPRGFGFVKFRYPEDAADAKQQLDHAVIGGREIRIVFAEENRKTPQEMRRITSSSRRGSYRGRSPSRSPRHRYRSHSRSPTPPRYGSRDRERKARDGYYSPHRSRSISRSVSPRDDRSYRSDERSPRRPRSIARSISPGERNTKPNRSPSPSENGQRMHDSPRRISRGPSRSRSRSYSPR